MDKALSRSLMKEASIPCPPGIVLHMEDILNPHDYEVAYPCVVKPSNSENSIGVSLVHRPADLAGAVQEAFTLSPGSILVEKFIAGREFRCCVVEVLNRTGSSEVTAFAPQEFPIQQHDIRKFSEKLQVDNTGSLVGKTKFATSFLCKETETLLFNKIQHLAIRVHKTMQFRDFSMIDVRVDSEGEPWVLEVNLFSSFGSMSTLTMHAINNGWTEEELFEAMLNNADVRDSTSSVHLVQ